MSTRAAVKEGKVLIIVGIHDDEYTKDVHEHMDEYPILGMASVHLPSGGMATATFFWNEDKKPKKAKKQEAPTNDQPR